jgi:hypothetical protein
MYAALLMNATGANNTKGVSQPSLDGATFSVAKHYRGHVASFSENTDNYRTGVEMLACKYNMGTTFFYSSFGTPSVEMNQFGRLTFANYIHSGTFETANEKVTQVRNGIPPSCCSYAGGLTSYAESMKPLMIGGRNSHSEYTGFPETNYETGQTASQLINRASTFRTEYYLLTTRGEPPEPWEDGEAFLESIVPDVLSEGAWYSQFCHWNRYQTDEIITYFEKLNDLIGAADVFRGSWDMVMEYYWAREAVDSVSFFENTLLVNHSKKYEDSPYHLITTPVWIRVDLSETGFAGKDIIISTGERIRNMGSDVYYIPVHLNYENEQSSVKVMISTSPRYVNLATPNVSILGNVVTSDQPVKLTLWSKLKTEPYLVNATLNERKLTFGTNFTLNTTLNTMIRDYFLAFINEDRVSGVLQF